ncbi:MAG TPA: DUF2062 domain-containing protein [Chthoniobacterales bacterium]
MDIRAKVRHLLTLNATPHSIAMGAAIGVFFGFMPVFGFKTLLSYFSSLILRANTAAAILAVTLHDVLLPLMPVFLRLEYQIGYWLTSHPHHLAPPIEFHEHEHFHLTFAWFRDWHRMVHIGWPIMIGSVIIATVAAAATYGVVYGIFHVRFQRRMRSINQEVNASEKQGTEQTGQKETSVNNRS